MSKKRSMYDLDLIREILRQILWSAETIVKRFEPITSPQDFSDSDAGLEKLDAICMQLIAIGESVKHLDRGRTASCCQAIRKSSGGASWACVTY